MNSMTSKCFVDRIQIVYKYMKTYVDNLKIDYKILFLKIYLVITMLNNSFMIIMQYGLSIRNKKNFLKYTKNYIKCLVKE